MESDFSSHFFFNPLFPFFLFSFSLPLLFTLPNLKIRLQKLYSIIIRKNHEKTWTASTFLFSARLFSMLPLTFSQRIHILIRMNEYKNTCNDCKEYFYARRRDIVRCSKCQNEYRRKRKADHEREKRRKNKLERLAPELTALFGTDYEIGAFLLEETKYSINEKVNVEPSKGSHDYRTSKPAFSKTYYTLPYFPHTLNEWQRDEIYQGGIRLSSNKGIYTWNSTFTEEYRKYQRDKMENPDKRIPTILGVLIIQLCEFVAFKYKNQRYYRDMIGDAVLNCIAKFDLFNPDRGIAYSYWRTAIEHCIAEKVRKENKQHDKLNRYYHTIKSTASYNNVY